MIFFKTKNLIIFFFLIFAVNSSNATTKPPAPDLVVLFIIEGLSTEAPVKIDMPNFNALKAEGSYYKEMHLTLAGHPEKSSTYPWSCSMPNPMLMTGTPFTGKDGVRKSMIQHSFKDNETAFIVNARAYEDVSEDFGTYMASSFNPDSLVINLSMEFMKVSEPKFMRVHLQRPGIEGLKISKNWTENEPYHRNIWHKQSPYRTAITEADRQLGRFVEYLKENNKWENTVLIICSDNGQANEGWHEPYSPPSNVTPLLIVGPDVRKGATFEYCEIIDIAPTITYLSKKKTPALSIGRVLSEAFVSNPATPPTVPQNIKRLNKVLIEAHNWPQDKKKKLTKKGFKTIDDLGLWHTTSSGDNFGSFVVQQEKILESVR
ncbi:sulfatase-like protein [Mariniflexile fucanivorans]|uniref:Sulfatase-like protein n=1 Tax=Mariniflexile fucanivorans TaxID=264023 RepID=A0A4R1RL28_9FLAO|nr:sulfatase-like hydrolase/transferase [Mariniflexile fucanivorans]TCL66904.1 sulfatase-like protein [Mariniflexile fucanivorans]